MAVVSARQVLPEQISRNYMLELLPTKVPYGGDQGCATSGLVPIVGDGNPVNDVVWVSFVNGAFVMSFDGATAYIPNASDWNAINRKMICAGTLDFAAVRCGVAKTNHISHGLTFVCGEVWSFRLLSVVLSLAFLAATLSGEPCAIVCVSSIVST